MTALDLRSRPPRPTRETLLGFYFLPRTIDKLRGTLPGGNVGEYLNHDTGLSAYVVKRLGLDMNELRDAVATAADESAVIDWLQSRVDAAQAASLNAKLDSFVVERMQPSDRELIRMRHPVMAQRPHLNRILDIIDADDERVFAHDAPSSMPG